MLSFFRNIKAQGDVVGRDKVTCVILPQPTQFDALNEQYKIEITQNTQTDSFIDELEHYSTSLPGNRDLSQKLKAAGFNYLIDEATELKELVSKLIVRHQNYKSAQKIITLLLTKVESAFILTIKPKIKNGMDEIEFKKIMNEYLENEIENQLGENVLEIYKRQIKGMVFFLTGNCHLEWE